MRPFEYTEVSHCHFVSSLKIFLLTHLMFVMQIVLKDEADIDPNDQTSILEHLDKVVRCFLSHNVKGIFNPSNLLILLFSCASDILGQNATFFITTVFL